MCMLAQAGMVAQLGTALQLEQRQEETQERRLTGQ